MQNDPKKVEEIKIQYQNKILEDIFMDVARKTQPKDINDICLEELTKAVIDYCLEASFSSIIRTYVIRKPKAHEISCKTIRRSLCRKTTSCILERWITQPVSLSKVWIIVRILTLSSENDFSSRRR